RERQSITDKPVIDAGGNLWFAETGANLLTRIADVATPALPPAPAPVFTADTIHHAVSATGLRDVTAVDLVVARDGSEVAHASVPVASGAFTVDAPVRGGDSVRLTLNAPYPHAPLSFGVPELQPSVANDGSVRGAVSADTAPFADTVLVESDGRTVGALIARD